MGDWQRQTILEHHTLFCPSVTRMRRDLTCACDTLAFASVRNLLAMCPLTVTCGWRCQLCIFAGTHGPVDEHVGALHHRRIAQQAYELIG